VKRTMGFVAILALLTASATTARGFIDPTFTPVDLVEQSDVVLRVEFADANEEGTGLAQVKEVVKGDYEGDSVTVEFMAMGEALAAPSREVMGWIAGGQREALLFIGAFITEGGGGGERLGYLHVAGKWVVLAEWEGSWDMERIDARLLGCWAGSTDMLLRCVRYILENDNAAVPVTAGAVWQPETRFGRVAGAVHALEAVNTTGAAGGTELFLASDEGDRLYRFGGAAMEDVTAARGLAGASRQHVWADLTGDGIVDLLSWSGGTLSLHVQGGDGVFSRKALEGADALADCLSLDVVGTADGPRVVAAVSGMPRLLTVDVAGGVASAPLAEGDWPGDGLGAPGACLTADFDGDARPDVLQLFEGGSLFYKGTGGPVFGAPEAAGVVVGEGRHGACIGDYDADGLPDVFVPGDRRNRLFHNLGAGRFVDLLHQSGEVEYIAKPGATYAQTGDVNNDGRLDLLVLYGAQMAPQLFFNRGYRSFGHARDLDLDVQNLLPAAAGGQQAGCLGDFNGDGALDMVLALTGGDLWMFPRRVDLDFAMAVTAGLSPKAAHAGPLSVTATVGEPPRVLGTHVLRQGAAPALWGVPEAEAGDVLLEWRAPDGAGRSMTVEVIPGEEPQHVLLGVDD